MLRAAMYRIEHFVRRSVSTEKVWLYRDLTVVAGVYAQVEPGYLTQMKRIIFVIRLFIVHPDTGVSYTKQCLAHPLHRHCNDDVCVRESENRKSGRALLLQSLI